jgi:hypothetical protein
LQAETKRETNPRPDCGGGRGFSSGVGRIQTGTRRESEGPALATSWSAVRALEFLEASWLACCCVHGVGRLAGRLQPPSDGQSCLPLPCRAAALASFTNLHASLLPQHCCCECEAWTRAVSIGSEEEARWSGKRKVKHTLFSSLFSWFIL